MMGIQDGKLINTKYLSSWINSAYEDAMNTASDSWRCRICGLYGYQHNDPTKVYDHDFIPAACPHSIGDEMCPACKGESPSPYEVQSPPDFSSVDEMIRLVCLPEVKKQAEAEYGTLVKVSFTGFRFRNAQKVMQGDILIVGANNKTLRKIPVVLGESEELRTCVTVLNVIRTALGEAVSKVFGPNMISGPQRAMHDDMGEDMFGNEEET